jgi:asparagine synthase (glutamine-hydrolysing)
MCGIAGVYRFASRRSIATAEIQAMCELMSYRGPDGDGTYVDDDFGVGHRRLSIIDTSTRALQPMRTADGKWYISYNGEFYNYREVKVELAACGCQFRTSSDTEVLLLAFRQWGLAALEKINGMFAFAIWHAPTRTLTLVRDRLGIKPLYYARTHEGLAFASEIKCLLTLPEIKAEPNHRLLDGYMGVGYCPGEETFFAGIFRLQPGHYLQVRDGVVSKAAYWDMPLEPSCDRGERFYLDRTQSLLEDSVRLQLRSDVPLGVFLSGGVDSSAVVATMHQQGISNIQTFSVGWDYGNDYDEGQYAREVARLFGTKHLECRMTPQDFLASIPRYVWHMDEPVQEAAGISLYWVSKLASKEVKVVLSGEGADELFGGYPIYRYMAWLERYKALPRVLRARVNDLLSRCGSKWHKHVTLGELALEDRYFGVSLAEMNAVRRLFTPALLAETTAHTIDRLVAPYYAPTSHRDSQTRMQFLDIKSWLADDLLIKADRMSMATSIELRVPFLDHRFVEFAMGIPSKYRLYQGETKYLLKKTVSRSLPRHIVYRKKQGFPTPLAQLFHGPLRGYLRDVLLSDQCSDRGLFRPSAIRNLLDEHDERLADHHKPLWRLLILELWHRIFVDGEPWETSACLGNEVAA